MRRDILGEDGTAGRIYIYKAAVVFPREAGGSKLNLCPALMQA